MSKTTSAIRAILSTWIDAIDADNTHIDEDDGKLILDALKTIASPYISAYTAQRKLGLNKSQFYQLKQEGKIPKGEHIQGFKETHYNKYEMEKAADKIKSERK